MSSSKISGSIQKVGSRVTHLADNIQVEDLHEIKIEPTPEQKKAYEHDPAGLIRDLLTQEGHQFQKVSSHPELKIVSHLRTIWAHIVYDKYNPGNVCVWILVQV